jgi:hypothetical protein
MTEVSERGPGLRAAQHAITAARCVAATQPRSAASLAWQDLLDWPAWALDEAATRDALSLRVAALWHAGALRRCIDGRVLQQAGRLLGEPVLEQVLAAPDDDAAPRDQRSAGALPAGESLEAAWRNVGHALLLASLASPALRSAVAAHLHGGAMSRATSDTTQDFIDPALAQQLIARASALQPGACA